MGIISLSVDGEPINNVREGTQLVIGGPPNPVCPGGRCQNGGDIIKTYFGIGKSAGAANEGEPRGPQPWSAEQEQLASLAEGHLSARPASLWLTELRWPIQESGLHGS